MGGLRRWRKWVVASALAVFPGLLALEPVVAAPLSTVQGQDEQGRPPALPFPEEVEAPAPEIPVGDGTLGVPEDWDSPLPEVSRRTEDELPEPVRELSELRTQTGEVWLNDDGTQTATFHAEPINFQPEGSQSWERIDNSVAADDARPGWVRNAANDWTVWFGPITAGGTEGGVEMVTDGGTARQAPETAAGAATIAPVVGMGDESNQVTYPDVWPGVDVVYTVTGDSVEEEIVVEDGARSEFPFVVQGLGLREELVAAGPATQLTDPAAARLPEITGPQAEHLELDPLLVVGGDSQLANDDSRAAIDVVSGSPSDAGDQVQHIVVSVDERWMDEQADEPEPVIIDPTTSVVWPSVLKATKWSPQGGEEHACDRSTCGVQVGNSYDSYYGGDAFWRTAVHWDYMSAIQGKQVLYAGLWIGQPGAGSASTEEYMALWHACGTGFHEVVCGGDETHLLEEKLVTDSATFDITHQMQLYQLGNNPNVMFGFSGDQSLDWYSFKRFDSPALVLNLNTPPAEPTLAGPADNALAIATTTLTLTWNRSPTRTVRRSPTRPRSPPARMGYPGWWPPRPSSPEPRRGRCPAGCCATASPTTGGSSPATAAPGVRHPCARSRSTEDPVVGPCPRPTATAA